MNIKNLLLFAGLAAGLTSCDHLLEFEPGDVILAEDAIQDAEDLQRLLVSNYDVVANLYGGRVQIVNELRGPNFGEPDNSLDFTAVYNRETTFFTGINGGIYTDFYYAIYRSLGAWPSTMGPTDFTSEPEALATFTWYFRFE